MVEAREVLDLVRPEAARRVAVLLAPGHQVGALGDPADVAVDLLLLGPVLAPREEPDARPGGHDVGRLASLGDDVVDPGGLGHVLAQEVDARREGLDRVQGRDPLPRRPRGVGRAAVERDLEGAQGLARLDGDLVLVARVPGEARVDVVEEPVTHHEHLADALLLGRRAVHADRARETVGLHRRLEGEARADASGAEEVVSAAVTAGARDAGPDLGGDGLGQTG